jgi:hypothetical protein
MRVKSIRLQNFRCFEDSDTVQLKPINVLFGANNSGKSSFIRGLHILQDCSGVSNRDVRNGKNQAEIEIQLADANVHQLWELKDTSDILTFKATLRTTGEAERIYFNPTNPTYAIRPIESAYGHHPSKGPHHFIVPFLSKRRPVDFSTAINEENTENITQPIHHLTSKLHRLTNDQYPGSNEFSTACNSILGFLPAPIAHGNGQNPGVYLTDRSKLVIDQFGDGVPQILGILSLLAESRGKLFLIEELENDLHPTALKDVLDLILKSANDNQFVISTHSNIVVTRLCADEKSQLFRFRTKGKTFPTETEIITLGPEDSVAKQEALTELGYSFSDLNLYDGWLFLEESSAETIVQHYLIPWFTPKLKSLRTYSAGGMGNIPARIKELLNLVVFIHLQKAYQNKIWVRIDGGTEAQEIIAELKKNYPTFGPTHFKQWTHEHFEKYYPKNFQKQVTEVMLISDKKIKKDEKLKLLKKVIQWLDEDESRAKEALEESAKDIISDLKEIENQFTHATTNAPAPTVK